MRKLSQDFVKKYFEENGCKLISIYKNNITLMDYVCVCGNLSKITYNNFKQGNRCGCKKNKITRRKTQSQVENYFLKHNCKLLSKYSHCNIAVDYICNCGNKSKITFAKFKAGQRCKLCGIKKRTEKSKLKFEDIKKYFESKGCCLLSNLYESSAKKLKYICSCGNESHITFSNFKAGHRCVKCSLKGEKNPRWNPDRESVLFAEKFRKRCYSLARSSLVAIGKKKNCKTFELLGYTPNELKFHIMNHANWNLVKHEKWHIDHVFPIKAFLDYGIKDVKLINCLENLQPILAKDNLSKQGRYSKIEFENWLSKFNLRLI